MGGELVESIRDAAEAIERAVSAARREAVPPEVVFDALTAFKRAPLPELLDALSGGLERAAESCDLTHDLGGNARGWIPVVRLRLGHAAKGARMLRQNLEDAQVDIAWISAKPR